MAESWTNRTQWTPPEFDFSLTISDNERQRYRDSGASDPAHLEYQDRVEKLLDRPLIPPSIVRAQWGAGPEHETVAGIIGDYKGGDLTPRQYLSLTPLFEAVQSLRDSDVEAYSQKVQLAQDPGYVSSVVSAAIGGLKGSGGEATRREGVNAVYRLINALEDSAVGGRYQDEASIDQRVYERAVAKDPEARLSLMTEGARKNATRGAVAEFFRAMQDGQMAPPYANWADAAMNLATSAVGWDAPTRPSAKRTRQVLFDPAFRGRSQIALERLDASGAEAGGPTKLYDKATNTFTVDDPLTWEGVAQIANNNPQYAQAGLVAPVNSVLANKWTILGGQADGGKGRQSDLIRYFVDRDNRNNRVQPLRLPGETSEQASQRQLDEQRYAQGMRGWTGAFLQRPYNAAMNAAYGAAGGSRENAYPPNWMTFAASMPNEFMSNAYSAAAVSTPAVLSGLARGTLAGSAAIPGHIGRAIAAEIPDEFREEVAQQALDSGDPVDVIRTFASSPPSNAYVQVPFPSKSTVGRETYGDSPSSGTYGDSVQKAQQFYQSVLDRGVRKYAKNPAGGR